MNTHKLTAQTMTQQIVSRDFRLHYMDLYSGIQSAESTPMKPFILDTANMQLNREYFGVMSSNEFPLLGDFWIAAIVSMVVHLRHENHGLKIDESSSSFQGWAERVARSFGLTGMRVPSSMRERFTLRVRVFLMMHKEMHEDAL